MAAVKLPYIRNSSTNFDEIWHGDAYWPPTAYWWLKFQIFEIQDGGGRHLKNHKNCDVCQQRFD